MRGRDIADLYRFKNDKSVELIYSPTDLMDKWNVSGASVNILDYNEKSNTILTNGSNEIFEYNLASKSVEIHCFNRQEIAAMMGFVFERTRVQHPKNGAVVTDNFVISTFVYSPDEEEKCCNGIYVYDRMKREVIYARTVNSVFEIEGFRREFPTYLYVSNHKVIMGMDNALLVKEGHDIPLY